MRRIAMAAGTASLVGVLLLAACAHSKSGDPSKTAAQDVRGAVTANGSAHAASLPGAAPAADKPAPPRSAKSLLTSSALIRTADLTVEIAHGSSVPAQANRAEQIATAAGGQVYADERTAGSNPTAALTLKVPGPSLVGVLDTLSALGKERSRQSSTRDVTTEVADVSSRVRSAQASIDRLRVLFGRAVKVGDVIELESELARREAELESLQAQQRTLASQTAMATVTLQLSTAPAVADHKDRATGGFLGGLARGWQTFRSAAGGVATGIGAAVPFLVLVLLVGAAVVVVRRRSRTGAPPVVAPADPA